MATIQIEELETSNRQFGQVTRRQLHYCSSSDDECPGVASSSISEDHRDFVPSSSHDDKWRETDCQPQSAFYEQKVHKNGQSSEFTQITPLKTIHYAHGGYAAAAPMFVTSTKWMLILRSCMPQAHANLMSLLNDDKPSSPNEHKTSSNSSTHGDYSRTHRIIKWAQNNPIVTAYGCLCYQNENKYVRVNKKNKKMKSSKAKKRNKAEQINVLPAIEWDVFLDPSLAKHVDGALIYLENLTKTNKWSGLVDHETINAAHDEVERQLSRLISRMVLTHGSTTQLAMEAAGLARNYNFSRILRGGIVLGKQNNRSKQNSKYIRTEGIFVDEWLKLFAEGLHLGLESEYSISSKMKNGNTPLVKRNSQLSCSNDSTASSTQIFDPILCGLFLCLGFSEPLTAKAETYENEMAESALKITSLLGEDLKVVLDLKSRNVPPRVWAGLIDYLNARSLVVEGIGSFDTDEVRKIGNCVRSPLSTIIFFHSAGDLQRACHENKIKYGDTVYFNAGSLMWKKESLCEPASVGCFQMHNSHETGRTPWIDYTCSESDDDLPMFQPYAYPRDTTEVGHDEMKDKNSILEDYQKRFNLNIGLYVQEYAIGPDEIDSLVQLINDHPLLYSLGLAWGGLNGYTCTNTSGDGYSSQRYIGSEWIYNLNVIGDNDIESMPGFCSALTLS